MLVKPEELDTIVWMIKGANPEDAPAELREDSVTTEGEVESEASTSDAATDNPVGGTSGATPLNLHVWCRQTPPRGVLIELVGCVD